MIPDKEFLVVTAEFDMVAEKPYVTKETLQRKLVELGADAVVEVMTRTPDVVLMLAVPVPRPPSQLTI
jgi:hypothetical protein